MRLKVALRIAARLCLEDALRESNGNVAEAARIAGVNRTNFYEQARRYGVKLEQRQNHGNDAWRSLD